MAKSLDKVRVQAVTYSDHDLVSITIGKEYNRKKWGKGRWVLNSKLLFDDNIKNEIKECVEFWRGMKLKFNSILEWWDNLKTKIKDIFIENGQRLQRIRRSEQRSIETELNILPCKEKTDVDDTNKIREHEVHLAAVARQEHRTVALHDGVGSVCPRVGAEFGADVDV